MAQYFVVKKDGKEITSQGIAGAFESYDSFGRSDVIIEKHIIDTVMVDSFFNTHDGSERR